MPWLRSSLGGSVPALREPSGLTQALRGDLRCAWEALAGLRPGLAHFGARSLKSVHCSPNWRRDAEACGDLPMVPVLIRTGESDSAPATGRLGERGKDATSALPSCDPEACSGFSLGRKGEWGLRPGAGEAGVPLVRLARLVCLFADIAA